MANNLQLPVVEIEGVGPRLAQVLNDAKLYTVGDLLRVPSQTLLAITDQIATLRQAKSWRQMAQFLEIPAMTPQWADALISREVPTLHDLSRCGFDELVAHFEAAKQANRINDVPGPAQICEFVSRATLLANTGAIMGTVMKADGTPVQGATVKIGAALTSTDDRGRFRLSRLPLRQKLLLVASHPTEGAVRSVVAASPNDVAAVQHFTLLANSQAYRRSAAAGDKLPRDWGSQPFKAVEVDPSEIAVGDLVKVNLLYADGVHAKLVSKLPEFNDGEVHLRWAKFALADLPAGSKLHDHFIRMNTGWRKVRMSATSLRSYRRLQRAKSTLRSEPKPVNLDDKKTFVEKALTELKRARVL